MATEDLTTFTEVDTGGVLTVSAEKASVVDMPNQTPACHLYKDYTADYFDALDVDVEIFLNSGSDGSCIMVMGFTTTVVDAWNNLGSQDCVCLFQENNDGVHTWFYLQRGGGVAEDATAELALDTLYYATFSRVAGNATVTLKIYSDSARTTLVATLTVSTFSTSTKWRYLYAMLSRTNAGSLSHSTGYYQKIDLNLTPPAAVGRCQGHIF